MKKKYRILWVEDDKVDQMAFKRFVELENLPYDYTIASSVSESKKILDSKQFDVVIIDFKLGDGTAFDLFDLILETPIILVTGAGDEEIAVKAMKLGAYDYLIKDLEKNYLKLIPVTVENAIKRKKAENESNMLSHAIMNISESVYFTDMNDKIIFVNKAFCKTYGYKEKEIIGKESRILWKNKSGTKSENKNYPKSIHTKIEGDYYHKRKDGSEFPVSLTSSGIKKKGGEEVVFVEIIRDITERKQLEETLKRLSFLDGLTGIANRRNFDETFKLEWHRAVRFASPLSLIMIDVDYFKSFNDKYGHQAGDECLKQIANTIKNKIKRAGDFIARYGGEEFIAILPNTNLENAGSFAESLRAGVEGLMILHEYSKISDYVTISIGVSSTVPNKNMKPEKLILDADQVLYQAKNEGRNRVKLSNIEK